MPFYPFFCLLSSETKAFVGKADHRLAVELRGKRLGQRRAEHGAADRTARDTVQKVVVVRLRFEFPLVDRAAPPLCFDAVFGYSAVRCSAKS